MLKQIVNNKIRYITIFYSRLIRKFVVRERVLTVARGVDDNSCN